MRKIAAFWYLGLGACAPLNFQAKLFQIETKAATNMSRLSFAK